MRAASRTVTNGIARSAARIASSIQSAAAARPEAASKIRPRLVTCAAHEDEEPSGRSSQLSVDAARREYSCESPLADALSR